MKKALLLIGFFLGITAVVAQDNMPPAPVVNDEGGPVSITGSAAYTNPFFTRGVAQPLVILEDQAGFVDRNRQFIFPRESQTLGQITSDFFESPFTYSIMMPSQPKGTLRDVDNDVHNDLGVQIFAIAYWSNAFGDPYLEQRDLYGGGWSSAHVSTRVSGDADTFLEIYGGILLVYALDDQQGFPNEFGADGLLFTGDEAVVGLPAGYTLVNMDSTPFTFDRSAHPVVDLIEGESAADDFSKLTYTKAFDAMLDKMRGEYAFTDFKGINWDALEVEFRPRFEEAETSSDWYLYVVALRDFLRSIPDGHVGGVFLFDEIGEKFAEGLGMAVRELDDGRILVSYILPDGPAYKAGIQLGAELLAINGQPIEDYVSANLPPTAPFSSAISERLEQLRWSLRFPRESTVTVGYRNQNGNEIKAVLKSEQERDSLFASEPETTGFELPLDYELLDNGYGYVQIYSFFDNELLTIQLWERMMESLNGADTPGLIIDVRSNGGGNGFLAEQMAAYFFNEPHVLGGSSFYDHERGEFVFDPNSQDRFFLPPENYRYNGDIAVLVGPNCVSACEFFSYAMTIENRAAIIGQYPTGGLGGSVEQFYMPEGEIVQFTIGRAVDPQGNIHVEGTGIVPTVRVPVNEETVFTDSDPILDAAVEYLNAS